MNGFGGVRMLNGKLRICPKLPEAWSELSFQINWHQDLLAVKVTKEELIIKKLTSVNETITLLVNEIEYKFTDQLRINLSLNIKSSSN